MVGEGIWIGGLGRRRIGVREVGFDGKEMVWLKSERMGTLEGRSMIEMIYNI